MDKVSIIVPVYNVAPWIEESIRSLLAQSYYLFEIVIVDDCSTDETFSILKRLSKEDSRIKLYRNAKNERIVKTLNFALTKASGDYILRHDGDDVAFPNRLQKQLSFLKENNLDLVGVQTEAIDEGGEPIGNHSVLPIGDNNVKTFSKYCSPIFHVWLAKKSVYDSLHGYRDIPYAEDYDFVLRALDAGYKCDNINSILIKIRHRAGNTSNTASLIQRKAHLYALKLCKQRKRFGYDLYDINYIKKLKKTNHIKTYLHDISTFFLKKAYNSNVLVVKASLVLLSCLFSRYNAYYIYTRLRVRLNVKQDYIK